MISFEMKVEDEEKRQEKRPAAVMYDERHCSFASREIER